MKLKLLIVLFFLSNNVCSAINSPQNIIVTGKPASALLIKEAIEDLARSDHQLKYNNEIWLDQGYLIKPLAIGEWQEIALRLFNVQNEGVTENIITFNIFNQPIKKKNVDYLIMSNEPEAITRVGKLFQYSLENQESIRLMYYHLNKI